MVDKAGPFGTGVSVHVEEVIDKIVERCFAHAELDRLLMHGTVWAEVLSSLDPKQKQELLMQKLHELVKEVIDDLDAPRGPQKQEAA